jgi:ribonuclease HI
MNDLISKITIYTDGACKGNPGIGSWACILISGDFEKCLSGVEPHTTNNRMELFAPISALTALKKSSQVDIYTDSQYVKNGITQWIFNWKKNGFKTANRTPVKNADLWVMLDNLVQQHEVTWHWVRGHNGHPLNERVDALANEAIDKWKDAQHG